MLHASSILILFDSSATMLSWVEPGLEMMSSNLYSVTINYTVALYCTALYCTVLRCTVLYCT